MKTNDENKPVVVFSGKSMEAQMIKIFLENANIEAFLKDEMTGTLAPWTTSAGGIGSVKILVAFKNFDEAKLIIDDYLNNISN